jgi:hypothetical protein
MNTSPNRVVTIATPLVFAPLAGTITALAARYAPGLDIDQGQLEAVFIAGATIAFAKSGLWLRGWQKDEERQFAAQTAAAHDVEDPYAQADEYGDVEVDDDFDADELDVDEFDVDDDDAAELHAGELDADEADDDALVEQAA